MLDWAIVVAAFILAIVALVVIRKQRLQVVTTRKALAQLAQSEQRLANALRGADDGLWDYDMVNNVRWYSPRWWSMLGREHNDIPPDASTWISLAHPDDVAMIQAQMQEILNTQSDHYEFEFRLLHKAGHYVPILARGFVQRDAAGKAIRLSGTNTDLTERHRVMQEREQFDRKLQETQKLESLGVLAGGIAHDFNNLLTGVLGNASLAMLDVPTGSRLHDYLDEINTAAARASELCRQMLAYSGRGHFVVQRAYLGTLIEQTTQLLQLSISKRATLRFHLDDTLPGIEVDATQVRQVIMNLVINASEALGDKGGIVTISTGRTRVDSDYLGGTHLSPELEAGEYVHLEVADTGMGMTSETRARIFDPFFTTKFTGRGLGLAAVLGIMRGHNGALKVYSEPGLGSTFKVLFPASNGEPVMEVSVQPHASWTGRGTILVVDDEPSVRRTVARMVQHLGFTALQAEDGVEGVDLFRQHNDDITLVMLDLTMPNLDGEQTFAELRRTRSNVRVVLMSGFNQQEAVARFAGKGLASFLQKPFSFDTLRDSLEGVLTAQKTSGA